jgi:sulfonate transport system substrate-binding protein
VDNRPPARPAWRSIALGVLCTLGLASPLGPVASSSGSVPRAGAVSPPPLSGVTINFGDQLKEYQTVVDATDALKGAPYSVSWSNFLGGPPIIAAETGGSVDLGDMAETPTIFAQAAGDPVKVVAVSQGVPGSPSPYAIMVPTSSTIRSLAQLRGATVAVEEGTVEQYVLIKALRHAGVPYNAVHVENLSITAGVSALESDKVGAIVTSYPFIPMIEQAHKGKVLTTGAGITRVLGYLTASDSALANPKKAAAIADFVGRLYRAQATLQKNPTLAAETYVKTYGVSLQVAEASVKAAKTEPTPITPAIVSYQQGEANAFVELGLVPKKLDVARIFDRGFNQKLMASVSRAS